MADADENQPPPQPEVQPEDEAGALEVAPPDVDFSGDEGEDGQAEMADDDVGADADKQEAEELEAMNQAASAAVEEHLLAEQQQDQQEQTVETQAPEPVAQNEPQSPLNNDSLKPGPSQGATGANANINGQSSRFPCLTPNKAQIPRLPSPRGARGQHLRHPHVMTTSKLQMVTRTNNPTKAPFPSKVTMSARAKVGSSHPSNYVFNPRRSRKVIGWDEAMSARPPLRIDMEGPTPCSYTPSTKPLYETNAPKWTFGNKTFVEKTGSGARTSWDKTWFQSPDVWTQKADFFSDKRWPPPSQYQNTPAMGPHHPTARAGHSHSIGIRRASTINKKGSEGEPAPCDYNRESSDLVTRKRAPAYTHSFRRGGTLLWSVGESLENPGPGQYNPRTAFVNTHHPSFSIQGIRREKSHVLGPYATF